MYSVYFIKMIVQSESSLRNSTRLSRLTLIRSTWAHDRRACRRLRFDIRYSAVRCVKQLETFYCGKIFVSKKIPRRLTTGYFTFFIRINCGNGHIPKYVNPAALFLLHMATFAAGGSDIGQLLFKHQAGHFQLFVLGLDFFVTTYTHPMISSLIIVY